MTLRGHRLPLAYLTVGAALTGAYFAFPRGSAAQSVVYDGLGFAAAAAIVVGVRLHRPSSRLPWLLFAAGNVCFSVGDILFSTVGASAFPSIADCVYLAAYPMLAAGLIVLLVKAGGHHRTAAIGEGLVFTAAFALIQWTLIVEGVLRERGSLFSRLVAAGYPTMDIVLLAALAGFFVSAAWRTPAFVLLVAGVVPLLVADELYAFAANTYSSGDYLDAGWLLSYALWGAAALHPSMRELSQPRPRGRQMRVSPLRVAVLVGALLTPPAVLLVQHERGIAPNVPAVVAASAVVSVLVVMRLVGMLRALERIRTRLVEADRVKDEFVALVSHDLRTPLTSVVGYLELALDDELEPPLDPERRGYLDVVSRSSQRLLRLVDDLLFVARLQTGRLDLTPTALDLRELARQASEEAQRHAAAKGVELVFVADGPVRVDADKGRMFQLLDNLVSNAIKFTPEGGRVEVAVSANGDAVLEVRDTGIGFSDTDATRVFERFFRTGSAIEGQIPGTGLGLFIAQAITEAHGGRISAAPRSDGGAVFTVALPRAGAGR